MKVRTSKRLMNQLLKAGERWPDEERWDRYTAPELVSGNRYLIWSRGFSPTSGLAMTRPAKQDGFRLGDEVEGDAVHFR